MEQKTAVASLLTERTTSYTRELHVPYQIHI